MKRALADAGAYFARKAWYYRQSIMLALPRTENGRRRLLIDVSAIAKRDARTGIQRVVRGIWSTLLERAYEFELVPVVASRTHGYLPVSYDANGIFGRPSPKAGAVEICAGDIFLGLDLSAHLLPLHSAQVEQWKAIGVKIAIVCYDLLPHTHPQFFTQRTQGHFARWLGWMLRTADALFCISHDVAKQAALRIADLGIQPSPAIHRLALGGNLLASIPSRGVGPADSALLERLRGRTSILMVGTIEPRKGYSTALDAFERLWAQDAAFHLVIVGKVGWKSRLLTDRLRHHPQLGKLLHWCEEASDEFIDELYQSCNGLLVTAHAEGYCLPVIEAAKHGMPILARDLPVLREHDYADIRFFQDDSPDALMQSVTLFLNTAMRTTVARIVPDWEQCGNSLLLHLELLKVNSNVEEVHPSSPAFVLTEI